MISCSKSSGNENGIGLFSHSRLAQSKLFSSIVRCADQEEGIKCFDEYRDKLINESQVDRISPESLNLLIGCFKTLSDNSNDLILLLKIQECYHQVDKVEAYHRFSGGTTLARWRLAINGFLIAQVLVLIYYTINHAITSKEVQSLKSSFKTTNAAINSILPRISAIENQIIKLNVKIRSEISNVQARLNKGGNIRKELDLIRILLINSKSLPPMDSTNNLQDYKENLGSHILKEKISKREDQNQTGQAIKGNVMKQQVEEHPHVIAKLGGHSFDLNSPEGLARWRSYCQKTVPTTEIKLDTDQLSALSSALDSNVILSLPDDLLSASNENQKPFSPSTKELIPKLNKNGKPYRRTFVPGRGWISTKKLNEELQL